MSDQVKLRTLTISQFSSSSMASSRTLAFCVGVRVPASPSAFSSASALSASPSLLLVGVRVSHRVRLTRVSLRVIAVRDRARRMVLSPRRTCRGDVRVVVISRHDAHLRCLSLPRNREVREDQHDSSSYGRTRYTEKRVRFAGRTGRTRARIRPRTGHDRSLPNRSSSTWVGSLTTQREKKRKKKQRRVMKRKKRKVVMVQNERSENEPKL